MGVFQKIALGFAVAMLLAITWQHRHSAWMQSVVHTDDAKPTANIKFDNGTARQMADPASDAASAAAAAASALAAQVKPPGGVRKCKKGTKLVYTDGPCPEGVPEANLGSGTVNLVPMTGNGHH